MLVNFSTDTCLVSNIEDLIEVKSPYFALDNMYFDNDGWLVAKAPVECQCLYENTLMDASEVGRHLAILGSCFGALANPEKSRHYYLAYQAELNTSQSYISNVRPNYLYMRAKAKFVNKRELVAETELLDKFGDIAARLIVKYHVMKEKSFNRVYKESVDENLVGLGNSNPYSKNVDLEILQMDSESLIASIGEVTPEMCVGHFDKVKALPVAILSQCFLNSSYTLLTKNLGEDKARFVLKSCELRAEKLATSGQIVEINVQLVESNGSSFTTKCVATNQIGEIVGEMDCYIQKL